MNKSDMTSHLFEKCTSYWSNPTITY